MENTKYFLLNISYGKKVSINYLAGKRKENIHSTILYTRSK